MKKTYTFRDVTNEIEEDQQHTNWRDMLVGVFDIESDSVDPREARMIQLYIQIFGGGTLLKEHEILFNPGRPIPEGASLIHGIYDKDVVNCPCLDFDSAKELYDNLSRLDVLVAYNGLGYDYPLLNAEFERHIGKPLRKPMIDPLIWARHIHKRMSGLTLDKLLGMYRITTTAEVAHGKAAFHNAKTDVAGLSDLLWAMASGEISWTLGRVLEVQEGLFEQQQSYLDKKWNRTET